MEHQTMNFMEAILLLIFLVIQFEMGIPHIMIINGMEPVIMNMEQSLHGK